MKTGALIIASGDYGEEYRDNEGIPLFLPMYPLDGTTVIKGEIAKLRKAGVSPIVVLAGCHSETLKLHLSHNNVIFLEDEAYREHSFEETFAIGLSRVRASDGARAGAAGGIPGLRGQHYQSPAGCGEVGRSDLRWAGGLAEEHDFIGNGNGSYREN